MEYRNMEVIPESQLSTRNIPIKDVEKVFVSLKLQDKTLKTADDVLELLLSEKNYFKDLLGCKKKRREVVSEIWSVISSCCESESKHISDMLKLVAEEEDFMSEELKTFLKNFEERHFQTDCQTVENVTTFLESLQRNQPFLALSVMKIVLPILKEAVKFGSVLLAGDLFNRLEILERNFNTWQEAQVNQEQDNSKTKVDYRNMSVLPHESEQLNDVQSVTLANIADLNHRDVDQYLDFHFRLNWEYFIAPLRERIAAVHEYAKQGHLDHIHKTRIHQNVCVNCCLISEDGILHEIQFQKIDSTGLLPWDESNHFTVGTLLCFTTNLFKTMSFASVAVRDAKKLQEGKVVVQFQHQDLFEVDRDHSKMYTVVETDTNFEIFYPLLNRLQMISADSFPLKEYLIYSEHNVKPPAYVQNEDVTYCLGPMLQPAIPSIASKRDEHRCTCMTPRLVRGHIPSDWASSDLALEDNGSLRSALIQSVALIHCPPGSDEAQIGVKILQILLHNRHIWARPNTACPIVVVCNTNHKLDSFLGALSNTTSKIVRIAGPTKNKVLAEYNLKHQIQRANNADSITSQIREIEDNLRGTIQQMSEINYKLKRSKLDVLLATDLAEGVGEEHLNRLTYGHDQDATASVDTLLRLWLGVKCEDSDSESNVLISCNGENTSFNKQSYGSTQNPENLADVQDMSFLIEQRTIHGEFQDAKVLFCETTNNSSPLLESLETDFSANLNVIPMTVAECAFCRNLWDLKLADRWRMYRFWVNKYLEKYEKQLLNCKSNYNKTVSDLAERKRQKERIAISDCDVVGFSASGLSKYSYLIDEIKPKIVVVKQAAQLLEAQILLAINEYTQHLILIGDHKQLKPIPKVQDSPLNFHLNVSLFERLYQKRRSPVRLVVQQRMRPYITSLLVPFVYDILLDHPSVTEYENIKGMEKNIFFITHSVEEIKSEDGRSITNPHEISFLTELCRYILIQGYDPSRITVLTPYLAQWYLLKKRLAVISKDVQVCLLDNYADQVNDIILLSFVRSNTHLDVGFLESDNRLCMALTRARIGLYCIGNFQLLCTASNLWRTILSGLEKQGYLGNSLNVKCQVHGNLAWVKSSKDFVQIGDGGCSQACNYLLKCGHRCPRKCHPNIQDHKDMKCMERCEKIICKQNHRCEKLCWEICGNCLAPVSNVMHCGHTNNIPCIFMNHQFFWEVPDRNVFGHKGDSINKVPFAVKVNKDIVNDIIHLNLDSLCDIPCEALLDCGHLCKGNCSLCYGGRIHAPCKEVCRKTQICGHPCLFPCANICPPCSLPHGSSCSHAQWETYCGFPNLQCLKPCSWSCEHVICNSNCNDVCSRLPCNQLCRKPLKCEHSCIGMCGETCPKKCRICDYNDVTTIFFGNEANPGARFIQLEDCGHMFEMTGLDRWVQEEVENNQGLRILGCPICFKPMLKTRRYGYIVKPALQKLEVLKRVRYQKMVRNTYDKKRILMSVKDLLSVTYERDMKCGESRETDDDQSIASTDPSSILETLFSYLSAKYTPTDLGTLALYENYFNITLENFNIVKKFAKIQEFCLSVNPLVNTTSRRICEFVGDTLEAINERILYFMEYGSSQFVDDITWELRRLHILSNFFLDSIFLFEFGYPNLQQKLTEALNFVMSAIPFRYPELETFVQVCSEMKEMDPRFNVSENIRGEHIQSLKAMSLAQGNWYECPDGDLYSVDDPAAVVNAHCGECDEDESQDCSIINVSHVTI